MKAFVNQHLERLKWNVIMISYVQPLLQEHAHHVRVSMLDPRHRYLALTCLLQNGSSYWLTKSWVQTFSSSQWVSLFGEGQFWHPFLPPTNVSWGIHESTKQLSLWYSPSNAFDHLNLLPPLKSICAGLMIGLGTVFVT